MEMVAPGGGGWGGGRPYFPLMALALKGELCAISPGSKMSPWACCCRCLLSICMIFFYSVLSPVCCEVGVLAPSQRLDPSFIGR